MNRSPRYYRDRIGRLYVDGQLYMGRNRVPPLPNRIAMTDRTTGLVKVLSHTGTPRGINLVERQTTWPDVTLYAAYEGPYNGNWRLYLDSGSLAFEAATDYNSSRILTRLNFDTTVLELTAAADGSIVYTEVTL